MPPFRFLHASDFHLEQPAAGLAEVADHLREPLIEAPYRAACNVFDAALRQEVDFVVLAGDLVAPHSAGPRGILFLRAQCSRLAERNIGVYWAGGAVDRVYEWPAAIGWHSNVHFFPADAPQRLTVIKRGEPLCEIVGQSLPDQGAIDVSRFAATGSTADNNCFVIGLAHGDFDDAALRRQRIDYWALGGEHEPTLPDETRPVVHHPGSPQGRSPVAAGPHGCTLVHVIEQGDIRTTPIVTDVVRYCDERLSLPAIPSHAAAAEIEDLLRERLQALADANAGVALAVTFTLDIGESMSLGERSRLPLPAITGVLRGEFGYRSPPVWLDRLQLSSPSSLPESWFQQQTLLGDFLQAARRQQLSSEPIELDRYLPAGKWHDPLCEALQLKDRQPMQAAVQDAAILGASLLYPEEAHR